MRKKNESGKKHVLSVIALLLITITVAGCATDSSNYCDLYNVVRTLETGAEDQKLAVDINNAIYLEVCL